jgi:hypothetical protein
MDSILAAIRVRKHQKIAEIGSFLKAIARRGRRTRFPVKAIEKTARELSQNREEQPSRVNDATPNPLPDPNRTFRRSNRPPQPAGTDAAESEPIGGYPEEMLSLRRNHKRKGD